MGFSGVHDGGERVLKVYVVVDLLSHSDGIELRVYASGVEFSEDRVYVAFVCELLSRDAGIVFAVDHGGC